jgi:superfamily I DNA/RNA helicase
LSILKCLHDPEDRLSWETIQTGPGARAADLRAGILRLREVSLQTRRSLRERVLGLAELPSIPFRESPWKEMLEKLLRASMAFGPDDWPSFLHSLCLSKAPDFLDLKSERVTLATLHSAKGLEFPVVFIAGCEDLLLPCRLGPEVTDPEEERRLFYVGMTRACRLLVLTRARSRFLYGERREHNPCSFLQDISPGLMEKVRLPAQRIRKKPKDEQLPLFSSVKEN